LSQNCGFDSYKNICRVWSNTSEQILYNFNLYLDDIEYNGIRPDDPSSMGTMLAKIGQYKGMYTKSRDSTVNHEGKRAYRYNCLITYDYDL
jgi:hypothetical protein